jgi:hypothetical protein
MRERSAADERRLSAARKNSVAWAYATSLMNKSYPFATVDNSMDATFGLFRHGDGQVFVVCEWEEGAARLKDAEWVGFTEHLKAYPLALRDAKQVNGHARLREASTAEILRNEATMKPCTALFVGHEANPKLVSCLPRPRAVIVVEVQDVRSPPLCLLSALPAGRVRKTQLIGGTDVFSCAACVVYWLDDGDDGKGAGSFLWPERAAQAFLKRREAKINDALDIFSYVDALRLNTTQTCLDHYHLFRKL